jgi:hypothetical protein
VRRSARAEAGLEEIGVILSDLDHAAAAGTRGVRFQAGHSETPLAPRHIVEREKMQKT